MPFSLNVSKKIAGFGSTMSTTYSAASQRFNKILVSSSNSLRRIAAIAISRMSALVTSLSSMLSVIFFSRRETTVLTASDTPSVSAAASTTLRETTVQLLRLDTAVQRLEKAADLLLEDIDLLIEERKQNEAKLISGEEPTALAVSDTSDVDEETVAVTTQDSESQTRFELSEESELTEVLKDVDVLPEQEEKIVEPNFLRKNAGKIALAGIALAGTAAAYYAGMVPSLTDITSTFANLKSRFFPINDSQGIPPYKPPFNQTNGWCSLLDKPFVLEKYVPGNSATLAVNPSVTRAPELPLQTLCSFGDYLPGNSSTLAVNPSVTRASGLPLKPFVLSDYLLENSLLRLSDKPSQSTNLPPLDEFICNVRDLAVRFLPQCVVPNVSKI